MRERGAVAQQQTVRASMHTDPTLCLRALSLYAQQVAHAAHRTT